MPRFHTLTGAMPDVCLRHSQRFEISIRGPRLRPRDASTALLPPFISCSGPQSAGQKPHSIPIDHGPAPSKSAYRKCSGERHSVPPGDFCAGAFPMKPKALWETPRKRASRWPSFLEVRLWLVYDKPTQFQR